MEKVAVVDFGGQYTHLIARRLRALGVYSEVVPATAEEGPLLQAGSGVIGVILSGGPSSVYDADAPPYNPRLLATGFPTLGLCYGHQLLCRSLAGEVRRGEVHEFGPAALNPLPLGDGAAAANAPLRASHPLFAGVRPGSTVWMSHGDEVKKLPPGFRTIGSTADCEHAAVADDARRLYGLQFHPEVTHSEEGQVMLKNFLALCGARFEWKVADYLAALEERLRRQCAGRKVFLLVSGGVDSTVAFALLNRALGPENVLGLHIDNGLMREGESGAVLEYMNRHGFHNLEVKDASETFLAALKGVYSPEAKRKIIGDTFLQVKDAELLRLDLDPDHWLLAQGTIYPDTIESGGTPNAALIKTHHNRVDAIRELLARGLVVEPLADFYKDEVRELGEILGLPKSLVWRHPFPGPGLGVRLLCNEFARKDLAPELTERVQAKVKEMTRAFPGWEGVTGELLPVESVGVQGDARTYAHPCLLRGLPLASASEWEACERLSTALTNSLREANRMVLEIGKVPGDYALVAAEVSEDRLRILRRADALCTAFLERHDLYDAVWQMPVVLLPLTAGGRPVVVMRPVISAEAMTARFAALDFGLLKILWETLREAGIGALFYDITHKPPGTIEWE